MKGKQRAFAISKQEVLEAWKRVEKRGGKGGVDGESIRSFREKRKDNLYKLWNRMASGSYHPQGVLRVAIPKGNGEQRELGIPTVLDRVAQQVVKGRLEKVLEPIFHQDSYGYRRRQSAPVAVARCRQRCWEYDWALDVDIRKFFDTIDHDLMMKAVRHHCEEKWMLMYIERWLKAEVHNRDGSREQPQRGTPQGGVISPVLANLYLHYAMDLWLEREYPSVKFERYADDAVIHCKTAKQAEELKEALGERLKECGLALHPKKTKVVYCKDSNRPSRYPAERFTFLGYTFESRTAKNGKTGQLFNRFLPAVSKEAGKYFRDKLKKKRYFCWTHQSVEELAETVNPLIRGFYNYFRHFYASRLHCINDWLDERIANWWRRKSKSNRKHVYGFLRRLAKTKPKLFVHWTFRLPGRAV